MFTAILIVLVLFLNLMSFFLLWAIYQTLVQGIIDYHAAVEAHDEYWSRIEAQAEEARQTRLEEWIKETEQLAIRLDIQLSRHEESPIQYARSVIMSEMNWDQKAEALQVYWSAKTDRRQETAYWQYVLQHNPYFPIMEVRMRDLEAQIFCCAIKKKAWFSNYDEEGWHYSAERHMCPLIKGYPFPIF